MSQSDLMDDMPPSRSETMNPSSLAILITVPEIKLRANPGNQLRAEPRMRTTGGATRQRQRRLRRRVRFAGYAMLALVPIASACTIGWSSRPDRILACSISDPVQLTAESGSFANAPQLGVGSKSPQRTIASPEGIALSNDQAASIPGAVAEAPVVFPGYVLPDDSREDSLHEGS